MSHGAEQFLTAYREPGAMTSVGRHSPLLDDLPHGIEALAAVGHGLVIHEHIAPAYGVDLPERRRASVHVRPVEQLLDWILADDARPLTEAREPARRLPGNCRHYTVLAVAFLRAQGVPARARCGFGGYFGSGAFEDHWVCEYWKADEGRWALADAQIDATQRGMFEIDFELTDVPRDRFVVAGDAWARCRAGEDDPARYGLSVVKEAGDWWIAGNLLRDVAALNNVEMLPWDAWGAMPAPGEEISGDQAALFDRLAALTHVPDEGLAELRAVYTEDERVRVPQSVFNAVRGMMEEV
jgi:Transglutaminase-like superfamily